MKLVRAGRIVYDEELVGRVRVFKDRIDAGKRLGEAVVKTIGNVDVVYAIPRGGIPVGLQVAYKLGSLFDVAVCRKLLIPWNREAGFGAMDPSGKYFVDEQLVLMLGLSEREVRNAIEEQAREIKHRLRRLRGREEYPNLSGLKVIVVDDGIAAGYTMMACAKFLRDRGASRVYVAVPTCHLEAATRLLEHVDELICLNPRSGPVFAVAEAYIEWRDLEDEDVIPLLNEARRRGLMFTH